MPMRRELYPDDWEEISKRIRFIRAEGRCECTGECEAHDFEGRCEAINYDPHPITGSRVVLTVAHLNDDKMDCSDENLKAMCQRCHLNLDRDEHRRNRAASRRAALRMDDLFDEGKDEADA